LPYVWTGIAYAVDTERPMPGALMFRNIIIGVVLMVAIILTNFMDNSATAIVLAPLAYETARELNVNPYPF
jgi:di/tricarboxylate transporter